MPEHLFGWKLIGATLNGVLEYSSIVLRRPFLAIVVAVTYGIVVALRAVTRRSAADEAPAPARRPWPFLTRRSPKWAVAAAES